MGKGILQNSHVLMLSSAGREPLWALDADPAVAANHHRHSQVRFPLAWGCVHGHGFLFFSAQRGLVRTAPLTCSHTHVLATQHPDLHTFQPTLCLHARAGPVAQRGGWYACPRQRITWPTQRASVSRFVFFTRHSRMARAADMAYVEFEGTRELPERYLGVPYSLTPFFSLQIAAIGPWRSCVFLCMPPHHRAMMTQASTPHGAPTASPS